MTAKWYAYYVHQDGDRMIYTGREWIEQKTSRGVLPDEGYRFTPHHKLTANKQPVLFESAAAARKALRDCFVGGYTLRYQKWNGRP